MPVLETRSNKKYAVKGRLLLVSPPWPIYNRPSLPLGALKAYVSQTLPGVSVTASHFFLEVAGALGYAAYKAVSRRVWRAETIFAALLYPERADIIRALYTRIRRRHDDVPGDFDALVGTVKTVVDGWLRKIDWEALDMVGFSVSFCQVTAALYLVSRIKAIHPDLPVVVGGSSFSGNGAAGLLTAFPEIDYLVVGEGERPLVDLLHHRLSAPSNHRLPMIPGVVSRGFPSDRQSRFSQLSRIDRLPVPDFDDYFRTLAGFDPARHFFPALSLEASRGCWWHRPDPEASFHGCAFCNLNLQWEGYRAKRPQQVIREVDHLTGRHQVLALAFADNAFPLKRAGVLLDCLRGLERQLSIFTELRADTPPALLPAMRQAGVDTVQIGIEALSSRLLEKMNKGTRAIDNLSLMKHCLANGIDNVSNLMLHFPSSDAADVAETLAALEFVDTFPPLKPISFWLGLESPVYRFRDRFHIQAAYNHPNLKKLFPAAVAGQLRFMIQGYRGDRQHQRRLWRPVRQKVRRWQAAYARLQRQTRGRPALSFRDGGDFLMIDQHREGQPVERHRLNGTSAAIYRFCDTPRSIDELAGAFATHSRGAIRTFLTTMVAKRLMFAEDEHFLSLAVPIR